MPLRRVQERRRTLSVASGGTTSEVVANPGNTYQRGAIRTPAALTSTTATWHVSTNGTTFAALNNGLGAAYGAVAVAANKDVPVPAEVFHFPFFRLVLGTAETAARTIDLVLA